MEAVYFVKPGHDSQVTCVSSLFFDERATHVVYSLSLYRPRSTLARAAASNSIVCIRQPIVRSNT